MDAEVEVEVGLEACMHDTVATGSMVMVMRAVYNSLLACCFTSV